MRRPKAHIQWAASRAVNKSNRGQLLLDPPRSIPGLNFEAWARPASRESQKLDATLWHQKNLAGGFAGFEIHLGLGGVGQRIGVLSG